jgi:hypothetical protein
VYARSRTKYHLGTAGPLLRPQSWKPKTGGGIMRRSRMRPSKYYYDLFMDILKLTDVKTLKLMLAYYAIKVKQKRGNV